MGSDGVLSSRCKGACNDAVLILAALRFDDPERLAAELSRVVENHNKMGFGLPTPPLARVMGAA